MRNSALKRYAPEPAIWNFSTAGPTSPTLRPPELSRSTCKSRSEPGRGGRQPPRLVPHQVAINRIVHRSSARFESVTYW